MNLSRKNRNILIFIIIYYFFENKIVHNIAFLSLLLVPFFGMLDSWTYVDYVKKISVFLAVAIYFNISLFPEKHRGSILKYLILINVLEVALYLIIKKHYLVGILGLIISYYTPKVVAKNNQYFTENSRLWWLSNYAMIFYTYNKVGNKNRAMMNLFVVLPMILECMNKDKQYFSIRAKTIFIANLLDTFFDSDFWDTLHHPELDKIFDSNNFNSILTLISSLFPLYINR